MRPLLDRTIDSRALALTRILVAAASPILATEWLIPLTRATSGDYLALPAFSWIPVPSPLAAWLLFALTIVAAAALALGLMARAAAGAVAGVAATVMLLEQQTYSNHLLLLVCLSTLLAFSGAGRAWSMSRSRQAERVPFWPAFLIMALVTSVYAWTAVGKVNAQYLSGEVMASAVRESIPFPVGAFAALAVASIATEAFLAVALWIRRLRPAAFVVGAGLHASIILVLNDPRPLVPFAMLMLSGYVLFLADSIAVEGPRIVVWDSYCSFCQRWVRLFRALDLFTVHRFIGSAEPGAFDDPRVVEERAWEALQLVSPARHEEGFDAVRRILEASPVTFLFAPLLGLFPVRSVGRRVYRHVAAQRTCKVPLDR